MPMKQEEMRFRGYREVRAPAPLSYSPRGREVLARSQGNELITCGPDDVAEEGDAMSIVHFGGTTKRVTFEGVEINGRLRIGCGIAGIRHVKASNGEVVGTGRKWWLEATALAAARRHAKRARGK